MVPTVLTDTVPEANFVEPRRRVGLVIEPFFTTMEKVTEPRVAGASPIVESTKRFKVTFVPALMVLVGAEREGAKEMVEVENWQAPFEQIFPLAQGMFFTAGVWSVVQIVSSTDMVELDVQLSGEYKVRPEVGSNEVTVPLVSGSSSSVSEQEWSVDEGVTGVVSGVEDTMGAVLGVEDTADITTPSTACVGERSVTESDDRITLASAIMKRDKATIKCSWGT